LIGWVFRKKLGWAKQQKEKCAKTDCWGGGDLPRVRSLVGSRRLHTGKGKALRKTLKLVS